MTGKTESTKEQIERLNSILEGFERDVALPPAKSPLTEVLLDKYLNMGRDEIERLTPQDCSAIGYTLLQYSLFIQRTHNRDRSRVIWGETALKRMIAAEVHKFSGSWDYQEQQAIEHNDSARTLQDALILAKMRISRLYGVAEAINNIVKQLQNIQYSKREASK